MRIAGLQDLSSSPSPADRGMIAVAAGLIGPILIARGKDLTGSFAGILPLIAIVLSASVILPYLTKKPLAQAGKVGAASRDLVPTSAGATVAALSSSRNLWSLRAAIRGLAAMVLVALTTGFGSCSGGGGGPMYVLQGSVSGLLPGHSVVLQNYGSDSTVVSANGSFNFTRPFSGGAPYSVTVLTEPSSETCATANGSGTGTVGPGVSVDVVCAVADYVVNLQISGLGAATLVLKVNNNAVTVQDIGGAPTVQLSLNLNRPIGTPYAVTVATQPLGEDCTVNNGSGTAAIPAVNVAINCVAASYTIGGTVTGLSGGFLLGLEDNGGNGGGNVTVVSASGNFQFATPLPAGAAYSVTVSSQPPTESCVVSHGSGTVAEANVTNIAVACTVTGYTINLTVNGLNGTLVVQLNGNDLHFINTGGGSAIQVTVFQPIGTPYALTVTSQPQGQTCAVTNGSGPGTSNVNVVINCVASYTIGGAVSGLSAGNNVVLKDNGGNATTVSANGSFTFSTALANQSPYAVTVSTQPTGQSCSVANGSGTVPGANVTNVAVACTSTANAGLWTWESGSNTPEYIGVYGTQGTAAPGNVPGSREAAFSSTDGAGNLWMFGGIGAGNSGVGGSFNDLWRYSPSTGLWAWMGGADTLDTLSVYGSKGTAAAGNVPSAREGGSAWTDSAGDFWLFGGGGFDSTGSNGALNDLWRYSPSTGLWAWMSGPTTGNSGGVYGTLGAAAPGNVPGARSGEVSWKDSAGNFWLFGGGGSDSTDLSGYLNDLWRYSPGSGLWTWMGGSTGTNAPGVYGTLGTAASGNIPGARFGAVAWTDGSGNFWLFGGHGYDSTGTVGSLNDLWRYSPSTGQWTWMNGSETQGAAGVYGTLGTAAAGDVPGAREDAASWIDNAGNLWLFGDGVFDSNGNLLSVGNDLWRYAPSTGLWTWMGGSTVQGAPGVYGALGIAAAGNVPGGRDIGVPFIDGAGNFWLFGGYVPAGALNDLWKYVPPGP
jgi:N-acetylneuraminic acid mutarotase